MKVSIKNIFKYKKVIIYFLLFIFFNFNVFSNDYIISNKKKSTSSDSFSYTSHIHNHYTQDKASYSEIKYQGLTIGPYGCMIVCECLLYNFYFGTNYNPYEYIEFLKEHKLYNNDLYGRLKKYNIEYQFQGKNNFDLMNNDYFLNKNNIALCYVKNGKGHMIIVSGKNKDGLFFINDPSSSSPLTPFVAHTLDEIKEYASGNFHLIKLTKK